MLKFNGVAETKEDKRDYTIAQFIPHVDEIKDEDFCLPLPKKEIIINQGGIGSCVAHSFALCKSILEYQQTGKWIDFDPYMIYGTRYPADDYDGVGMYPRQGAKVLQKEGAYFRWQFNKVGEMPKIKELVSAFKAANPQLKKQAEDYRIEGYSVVYSDEQIKTALKNGMPVSATWELHQNFMDVGYDGNVPMPSGDVIGSHQMTIVGWTSKNEWVVLNSWGTAAGMKGLYYIPFGYRPTNMIAVSDTITPSKRKSKEISMAIGISVITVDRTQHEIDAAPIIEDNRTFVPARFVAEYLGASVEWDENEKKVTIRSEEAEIVMQIGNRDFVINGKKYKNDVAPFISNSRTLVPIRVIAENLNCEVEWNATGEAVTIKAL